MIDVRKDVLGDLIKYLRGLEIRDRDPKDLTDEKQDETLMDKMKSMDDREDAGREDGMMDLEEPDLDLDEEKDEGDPLTAKQEEIKDFFNNRRPKRGMDRKSKTFVMEAKVNGRPVAEVIKKSKK